MLSNATVDATAQLVVGIDATVDASVDAMVDDVVQSTAINANQGKSMRWMRRLTQR